ncbi:hypothetical protein QFZ86_001080 [Pseudomonas plecoglossicida]
MICLAHLTTFLFSLIKNAGYCQINLIQALGISLCASRWVYIHFCFVQTATLNGPHALEVPKPGELDFRHHGTIIGNAAIGVIEYSTLVSVKIRDLEESYSINLPVYGEQSIEHQGKAFVSNPSVGVILSPNQSLRMTIGEKCRKKMVKLSRSALEAKLSKLLGRKIVQPILFEPMVHVEGAMQEWWKLVESVQSMLQTENSLCDLPEVWSNFEGSLVTSLLFSQRHNYFDELQARQTGGPQPEMIIQVGGSISFAPETEGAAAKWLSDDTRHMLAELDPKPDQVTVTVNTSQMKVVEHWGYQDVRGTSMEAPAVYEAYKEMAVPAQP